MVWKAGLILTLTELVGDFSLKTAVASNDEAFKMVGHASYLGLSQVLYTLLKENDLAVMNAAWDTFSNVVTLLVAKLFFGEELTMKQYFGFVLCLSGIYFLEPEKK